MPAHAFSVGHRRRPRALPVADSAEAFDALDEGLFIDGPWLRIRTRTDVSLPRRDVDAWPSPPSDAAAPPAADPAGFETLGAVLRVERPRDGAAVLVCDGGARLRLDALADDTLRVRLVPPGAEPAPTPRTPSTPRPSGPARASGPSA